MQIDVTESLKHHQSNAATQSTVMRAAMKTAQLWTILVKELIKTIDYKNSWQRIHQPFIVADMKYMKKDM